jgi:hypothetical protein
MTPHPKMSSATVGVEMKRSPANEGAGDSDPLEAVSPNRSRNRGPAGRNSAAGVIERSNCNRSGSRNTR